MRSNAYLNSQDVLNWFKTPDSMEYTEEGFPILSKFDEVIPRRGIKILPFNYAKTAKNTDQYVHFYIQDYQFNRIWNRPQIYINMLKRFKGIVMPDFSWWYDMPKVMQQWQHFRNLWFARMCQLQGIKVIPSVNYGDSSSWEWCFKGLPSNCPIMLSTIGSLRDKNPQHVKNFYFGAKEMISQLEPNIILLRTTKARFEDVKSKIGFENRVKYVFIKYTT